MKIQENISLKNYQTFGVEVQTKFFAEANSTEELIEILYWYSENCKNVPLLFLGGGSNLLFTKNFEGLIIKINILGISEEKIDENSVLVTANAGENWHQFVQNCLAKNFGGLENLSLIPGNVGTCPIQNIGAYGTEIKDTFVSCQVLNTENLQVETLHLADCHFGYRDSIFKNIAKGKYIILSVTFQLTTQNHHLKTDYGAIQQELEKRGITNPTIQDVSEAVIAIRESKLPNPKIIGNAGSFFKNPTISATQFDELKQNFPAIPGYQNGNQVKVPAGWLIEQCSWKGKQIGNVACHELQALVIINKTGNATGKEIFDFSTEIINSVKEKFGIELEREVNII